MKPGGGRAGLIAAGTIRRRDGNPKNSELIALVAVLAILSVAGCSRDSVTNPAPPNTDPIVFDDDFGDGVERKTGETFHLLSVTEKKPVALIFGSYT